MLWVTATWTITAPGSRNPTPGTYGFRTMCLPTGRRTATVIGVTLPPGAGRGLTMHRGALRRSTMVAGIGTAVIGAGAQGRSGLIPITDRHSLGSLVVLELALVSVLGGGTPGFRSVGASRSTRGITAVWVTGGT